jgi:hypothetical protein
LLVKVSGRGARFVGVTAIAAVIGLVGGGSAQAALKAPGLNSPASSASVEGMPTFTWRAVSGAASYEFQLSDDQRFNSLVLGRGKGKGSQSTRNTAATLDKTVPDGNYFWRVRAIDRKDRVGKWSKARGLTKAWKSAPRLEGPADEFAVSWPSLPLMLRWTPVPHASKYLVTIATDPSLAQLVTPKGQPVEIPGIAYALQGTLPAGRYYWAITPVDAGGLRGTRSRVGSFTWTWPTATPTSLQDLNATPQVFDPLLSWDLVPGAARYEVEINPDDDFAAGSRVCCKDPVIGTSLSPLRILPNNNDFAGSSGYHWRVRAFDVDGNPGQWNRGQTFEKAYDDVTPSVPNINVETITTADAATASPLVTWDPVPGAAQYQVQWTTYSAGSCGWSNASGPIKTSSLAWTPLSREGYTGIPGGIGITSTLRPNGTVARAGQPFQRERAYPIPAVTDFEDGTYCVRVRALSDDSFRENDNATSQVISLWTQFGGHQNAPAFTYGSPSTADDVPAVQLPAPTYLSPVSNATVTRTPVLRWQPVAGARRYFVLIARDSNFTNVIDAAFTAMPAYAPNLALEDEATSYFWAVVPASRTDGAGISGGPMDYNPQTFRKLSLPPTGIEPASAAIVDTQPRFRWTPTEAAQKYRIQVSADPQFGDLLDDVVTASTAYTSSTPYPADTALYWRVRAEQQQTLQSATERVELRWSATQSFRRRLPTPALSGDIPLRGELPPPLTWSAVPGAVSYDLHIDEADGDSNDFNVKSPAGTFSKLTGIGTFKFKVRANFGARSGVVASAYSPPRDFTRLISPPPRPRVSRTKTRLFFQWLPAAAATSYKVEVSTTQSFARIIDTARTSNTSWAPTLVSPLYRGSRLLYWRVATVDEGNNVGAYIAGPARAGKPLSVRVTGRLRRNRMSGLTIRVRGSGKALSGASVRVSGAGVKARSKRTKRTGRTSFRVRPTRRGSVSIRVSRTGYADKTVTVRVR